MEKVGEILLKETSRYQINKNQEIRVFRAMCKRQKIEDQLETVC